MKEKQKNLLLLGYALAELREEYKISVAEAITDVDQEKLNSLFNKEYPMSPTKEELISLAEGSYKKLKIT